MLRSPERTYLSEVSTAYVMISCENSFEQQVIEQLKKIRGVEEILGTYGNYDIVAKVESLSIEDLRETIIMKIRRIKHICCTTTLMCAKCLV